MVRGMALLSTHQEDHGDETAKIAALRQVAERGWSDLSAGRFADVDDSSLGYFIAKLGAQPEAR